MCCWSFGHLMTGSGEITSSFASWCVLNLVVFLMLFLHCFRFQKLWHCGYTKFKHSSSTKCSIYFHAHLRNCHRTQVWQTFTIAPVRTLALRIYGLFWLRYNRSVCSCRVLFSDCPRPHADKVTKNEKKKKHHSVGSRTACWECSHDRFLNCGHGLLSTAFHSRYLVQLTI